MHAGIERAVDGRTLVIVVVPEAADRATHNGNILKEDARAALHAGQGVADAAGDDVTDLDCVVADVVELDGGKTGRLVKGRRAVDNEVAVGGKRVLAVADLVALVDFAFSRDLAKRP